MNNRCIQIIKILIDIKNPIKISELSKKLKVSNRTIRYDLNEIDLFLKDENVPIIKRKPKIGIYLIIPDKDKVRLIQKLYIADKNYNYSMSRNERVNTILNELILKSDYITIDYIAEKLMVSRTTIFNDMPQVRKWLQKYNIMLESITKHGIKIIGKEEYIRQAAVELFTENIEAKRKFEISKSSVFSRTNITKSSYIWEIIDDDDIQYIENCLRIIEKQLEIIFSDESFLNLTIYIIVAINRIKLKKFIKINENDLKSIKISKEYITVLKIAKIFEEHFKINVVSEEIAYFTMNISGSNLTRQKKIEKENWIDYEMLTKEVIENVSKGINIDLSKDNQLFNGFMEHLGPAMYRVKHKLKLKNPLLSDIKNNYMNLFNIVKISMNPVEKYLGDRFNDEEIGYFTMHFGASCERLNVNKQYKKNILIVCGTGIGTAKLLSSRLQSLFDVNIVDTIAMHQIESVLKGKKVDLIVTTIPIDIEGVISIKVNPLLTEDDINVLNNYLRKIKRPEVTMKDIVRIVEKNSVIFNYDELINDLSKMFNLYNYKNTEGVTQPMLRDLLKESTIKLNVDVLDWEDAIRKGGELLEKDGSIEHRYIDAMIKSVKDIGPYIVIGPGIAMPHARPEAGTMKIGMSLITLKKPINFGNAENDPVKIVVCLCAIDHSTHLKAMSQLVALLGDDKKVDKIKNAVKVSTVLDLIKTLKDNN